MLKLSKFLLIITVLTLSSPKFASCQALMNSGPNDPTVIRSWSNDQREIISWMMKPWSDDTVYTAIRKHVVDSYNKGTLPALVERYSQLYTDNPNSAQVQFEYFYALKVSEWFNDVADTADQRVQVQQFVDNIASGQFAPTYNFLRLAMMCDDYWELPSGLLPVVQGMGDRDPDDFYIQYRIAGALAATSDPNQQTQALQIADGLVAAHPEVVALYNLQGWVYYRRWITSHNTIYKIHAAAAYQRYLQTAKLTGASRHAAASYLAVLR